MAYPHIDSVPAKLSSYAKIAAMPAPNTTLHNHSTRKDVNHTSASPSENSQGVRNGIEPSQRLGGIQDQQTILSIDPATSSQMGELSLPHTSVEAIHLEPNIDSGDSYEEDQSQLSGSSLNKPQSFDTKSLASVTTFAMDDKESIRPDDSASVRAVDDENPHPPLSRNSSFQHEHEPPAHRSSKVLTSNVTIPGRRFPTLANPPRFGTLPISPVLESQDLHMAQSEVQVLPPILGVSSQPDEKLIEALSSTKERLPLLQLEEKVLLFLRNTANHVLDLPPQNSFTRLLTHKLADYYDLPHTVNEDNSSVRIYRSTPRALPIPLTDLAKAMPIGGAPGPSSAAVKIMRREQLGVRQNSAGNSTAPSSSVPSKATSENGLDGPSDDPLTSPTERTPSRDKSKLTREEREAQYKIARDRIFADFTESMASETTSNGENSTSLSRSSSSSGKRKTRRHKQPKDDSFEARSAYVPSYPPSQAPYANAYTDPAMGNGYLNSPSYDHNMYGSTPTQSFPGFDTNMPYQNMQGYHSSMGVQYSPNDWQAMQNMQAQNAYLLYSQGIPYPQASGMMVPSIPPNAAQFPDWYNTQTPNFNNSAFMSPNSPFPQQNPMDTRNLIQNDHYTQNFQRAYSNSSPHGAHHNHQGQKSLFNPQTRSFVPNGADGRPATRSGRFKNQARHSHTTHMHNSSLGGGMTTPKDDSLKKYGTPASLPKKPPPSETRPPTESNLASGNEGENSLSS